MPELRPYQLEAVTRIFRELHYRSSTLRVAGTASGKTAEQAAVARVWLRRGGRRVLYLAPREELLEQASAWMLRWMPDLRPGIELAVEQGERRAHDGARVILASVQSLYEERLARIPAPDLILADEAHLFYDALVGIFRRFPSAKRVGWTATPDRRDRQRLLPYLFESVAHVYELGEAIEDGYVVQPRFEQVVVEAVRLDDVAATPGGDLEEAGLSREMVKDESLHAVAQVTLHRMGERQTVVFATTIEHARLLERVFDQYQPGVARAIDGSMAHGERRQILEDFLAGRFQVLVSVVLLTYGWDAPPVSCVVMARPTTSRALYSQSIGRGLRLHPGKDDCLVVDIVGNTERHRLVTPEEALQPDAESEQALNLFLGIVEPAGGLEGPQPPTQEELEAELAGEDLEERRPISDKADVAYRVVEVDNQLAFLGIDPGERRANSKPATEGQVALLRDLGVESAELLAADQASHVLDQLCSRRERGWCTLKQARYLQRRRLNPNVTFDAASRAIDRIVANGGRVPRDLLLDPELVYRGSQTLVLREERRA